MNNHKSVVLFFCLAIFMVGHAKDWKLEVKAGGYDRKDCALSVDLSDYQPLNPKAYVLYEVENGQQKKVASQFLPTANGFSLVWILAGTLPAGTTRQYLLKEEKSTSATLAMAVEDTHKVLILKKKGNPILSYNYVLSTLPKGVDPIYKRSGYIHPIYSPKGNVLTNINPKDHRHHYGLWNPWTHLVYDGKLYDLWN
ncbi:MAG: PmoA family protein, partial [Massilibacteroides sp.]|nr:PmoA family protein [Massilibacteroides sp.]